MKKLLLWMIAFVALPGGPLFAQDLTGTWQGTLQAGREVRAVVKISKGDGSGLKAVMYPNIDQGGQNVPVNPITLEGTTVKMSVPAMGAAYEGKLNAEGTSITGTMTLGPQALPLTLNRATNQTAWAIPDPPAPAKAMAADANPVFEVATIKPSKPGTQGKGITVRGREFITINTSLTDLITFAYGIHARQIAGAPAWFDDKYDLTAKPDLDGQPNDKQLKTMLQKLLADRFKLTFHRDKKELSVYAISVGKTGSKLTKSSGDPNGLPGLGLRGLGSLVVRNANIGDFAGLLQGVVLDRPVVDQTALAGRFDFTLTWTPDEFQFVGMRPAGAPAPPPADAAAPDLFTAIQDQLGLKLDSTKAPAEVLVIDSVEKPSEN